MGHVSSLSALSAQLVGGRRIGLKFLESTVQVQNKLCRIKKNTRIEIYWRSDNRECLVTKKI